MIMQAVQQLEAVFMIVIVLSAAYVTSGGSAAASTSAPNLLQNPGFEDGLDSWHISEGTANYTADKTNPRSGSYCAKGEETYEYSLGRLCQDITGLVTPENLYRISGWMRTENVVGSAVIALDYVASDGWTTRNGYVMEIGHVSATTNWTYFESYFILPQMPADCVAAWFLFDFNNGKGIIWVDDVQLTQERALRQPKIAFLFDERRASMDTLDNEYSGVAQILRQCEYSAKSTVDPLDSTRLSEYDVVVVTCPNGSYALNELDAIESFVRGGGGLLLMGQWSVDDPTGLNQVAGLFGVAFKGNGSVRDPKLGPDAYMPTIQQFRDGHPVCTGIRAMGIFGGRVLSIGNNTALAWGDADTYGDLNNNRLLDAGEPTGANCIVLAAAELGSGRAIFISDTDLFDNDFLGSLDHEKLFFNIVAWLRKAEIFSLPAGARDSDPSKSILDNTKILLDLNVSGQGNTVYALPGETILGNCTYQIFAPSNPNEINQGFFIMSWTPAWPPAREYYIPIWNGISGLYPGTGNQTQSFNFTAPSAPGTYYLYWCRSSAYSMPQAIDNYYEPLGLQAHAKIVVLGPDVQFRIRVEPNSLRIFKPQSGQVEIMVEGINGSDSQVDLNIGELPNNVTATLSKSAIRLNETATLTISTAYGTPQGVYNIEVFGSFNDTQTNARASKKIETTILGPDYAFEISMSSPISVTRGSSNTSIVRVNVIGAFNSTISMGIYDLPMGMTANLSKTNITRDENLTLAVSASYATTVGSTYFTIAGTSTDFSYNATVWMDVQSIPTPYNLVVPPPDALRPIYRGESITIPIEIEAGEHARDYAFPIELSIELPPDLAVSWIEKTVMPDEGTTLRITALSDALEGIHRLIIRGDSLDFSSKQDIWVDVAIPPPPFWTTSWFGMLLLGVGGIGATSLAVHYYYKRWRKAKASLDVSYLTTASELSKLEELKLLGKISQDEYEKRRKEYERKLRGE
jgi:hypothetical protein